MKNILHIIVITVLASCALEKDSRNIDSDRNNQKQHLKELFFEWSTNAINKGNLWASDSCYPSWFADHEFNGTIDEMWGFPDSSKLSFSYSDINNDSILDQLVTFTPDQCDGGNASIWSQITVLTVSDNDKYETEAYMDDDIFNYIGNDTSGSYKYDSIASNIIYGTFYKLKKGDAHCCPSIIKPVTLDYKTRKVINMGENIAIY